MPVPQTSEGLFEIFLLRKNKVLFGSFIYHEPGLTNHFHYQNSGMYEEEAAVIIFDSFGKRVLETRYPLNPNRALTIDATELLLERGIEHFRGSMALIIASDALEDDMGQRDFVSFWSSTRGNACHVGFGGFPAINVTGKKEGKVYNMFCPVVVSNDQKKTLIVALNHSTEIPYNDTVTINPILHNLSGETLQGKTVSAPPMGLLQIDVDEVFGKEGKALLAKTGGRGTVTVLHRGHQFATVFFHIDRTHGDIVSGTHTSPASSIPYTYGVTHPLLNAWSEKSILLYWLWSTKRFITDKAAWYRQLWKDFFYYVPRGVKRLMLPLKDRTPSMVARQYDPRFASLRERLQKGMTFEEYVFGGEEQWLLLHNKVVWDMPNAMRRELLQILEERVSSQLPQGVVVEFGCGSGRNLFYLKSKYPHLRCIGYELSAEGVALGREAAKKFNLEVEFHQANLSEAQPPASGKTLAYSFFSLEQMPRTFMRAIETMASFSGGSVLCIEPLPELYPWSVRGIVARMRAIVIDHVRHVVGTLRRSGYRITEARALGLGDTLTEACVLTAHYESGR